MKRFMLFLALLCLWAGQATAATGQALRQHPYRGDGSRGGSFHIAIKDSLIGTAWERVTADTGFTQLSSDTTITWMFSPYTKLDSIRIGGKTHLGTVPTAIWTGPGTADSTSNNNFFQDNGQTAAASVSAVFGSGWSFAGNNYLIRRADTDFRVAGNWLLTIWANSNRTANPAATEILYSSYTSPDIVQIGFDVNGNVFGRLSDDGRATWDSVGLTADRYDSTWHLITLQTKSAVAGEDDSLRLTADRLVSTSVVFSNAATALTIDTASVAAFRGATTFKGRADEAYYLEDTTSFDRDMKLHVWLRGRENLGLSSDSAMVYFQGVGNDTIREVALDTVTQATRSVSDSMFSIFEAAFLDTIESLPLMAYATGSSPRGSGKLDSIATGRYHFNPFVLAADKYEHLILDEATFSVPDLSMVDTVHFQVRVYPEWKRAQGAGTNYYVLGERAVTGGSSESVLRGPWTIQGPVVVEVWARATAASSIGQVEMNGFRGRYSR